MQYMLLIYNDESRWDTLSDGEQAATMRAYRDFTDELRSAGAMVAADRLQPTTNATTVRVRDGEQLITDGPFAETKEQLGGYYIVDCPSREEALDAARELATLVSPEWGTIELRPVGGIDAEGRVVG
jgi:hypothetical protein